MAPSTDVGMAFVDAPTGLTGFLLAMRSPGSGSQNVEDIRGHWIVRVPVSDAEAVRALLERVQVWLRQEQIGETRVSVGEDVYRVGADYADLQQSSEANKREEATDEYGGEQAVRGYRVDKAPRYEPMSEGTSGG